MTLSGLMSLLLVEMLVIFSCMTVLLAGFGLVRRRRDSRAAGELASEWNGAAEARKKAVEQMLTGFAARFPQAGPCDPAEFLRAEQVHYERLLEMYLRRDAEELVNLPGAVDALLAPYRKLLETDAPGAESGDRQVEASPEEPQEMAIEIAAQEDEDSAVPEERDTPAVDVPADDPSVSEPTAAEDLEIAVEEVTTPMEEEEDFEIDAGDLAKAYEENTFGLDEGGEPPQSKAEL